MDFIALIKAAVLGVVEGLTEFLPISSTAHLLIGERMTGFADPGGYFTVMIQLGAILAVVWLYRLRIIQVIAGLSSKPDARRFALAIILAFIPAAIAGLALKKYVTDDLYNNLSLVGFAFIIGGVVMLLVERFRPKPTLEDSSATPPVSAFGIGVFQALALVPGVSRSGSTIVGGLLFKLDHKAAAEFSFFLAIPTMSAAFLVQMLGLIKTHAPMGNVAEIAVGFVFAFLSALIVVKPFLNFVTKAGFGPFAWYRILAGLLLLIAGTLNWLPPSQ